MMKQSLRVVCTQLHKGGCPRLVFGPQKSLLHHFSRISCAQSSSVLSSKKSSDGGAPQRRSLFTKYLKTSCEDIPKWPVPPVEQTVKTFLDFAKIVCLEDQYKIAEKEAKQFFDSGDAHAIQKLIKDAAERDDNFTTEINAKALYMEHRIPLIPDNPGTGFPLQTYVGLNDQLKYAAKVILGSVDLKERIDRGEFSGMTKAGPIEMYQYNVFFGTYRVPGEQMDDLRLGFVQDPQPKHITVSRNGHCFQVSVYDDNYQKLGEGQVLAQLQKVCEMAGDSRVEASKSLALMTGAERTPWALLNQEMKKNPENAKSLESMETGLFHVCLDSGAVTKRHTDDPLSAVAHQVIHGGGMESNSINRWFDKALQWVIGEDGGVSLLWEHSPGEAPLPVDLVDGVLEFIGKNESVGDTSGKFEAPKHLKFDLPSGAESKILTSGKVVEDLGNNLDFRLFSFNQFGKDVPKTVKVSPDSFIQVALQLAYYRIHGTTENTTYESGAMRGFRQGRTDIVRHPTVESKTLLKAYDTGIARSEQAKLIREAIDAHQKNLKRALTGQSFDRHMFALEHMSYRNGITLPKLFETDAYKALNDYKLSTSQVAMKCNGVTFYGPSGPVRCYGTCYNPRATNINFMVCSFKELPEMAARKFADMIEKTLVDMSDVLQAEMPAKAG